MAIIKSTQESVIKRQPTVSQIEEGTQAGCIGHDIWVAEKHLEKLLVDTSVHVIELEKPKCIEDMMSQNPSI